MYCMQCLRWGRNVFKTKENVYKKNKNKKQKFNGFDLECGMYFNRETGCLIFTRASHLLQKFHIPYSYVKLLNILYAKKYKASSHT